MTADEQLQQDWNCFGRADGYEAADEQEIVCKFTVNCKFKLNCEPPCARAGARS